MSNPFPQGTPLHELAAIINQTAQRWVKAQEPAVCERCDGKGYYPVYTYAIETGRHECPQCDGQGVIEQEEAA